eukprot:TRINITY_DN10874_c0_g2_i1.p1 TRINITY_DN10874_c0_g2~~TRINITY_DN10874_c0_g2_i1.p1  ORF type:complete len:125 (-),score=32.99 TRINITY_DN10874_c0_g2_i1:60-434(-)
MVLNKDYSFFAIYDNDTSSLLIYMIDDLGERMHISQDEFNRELRRLKREFEFSEGIMARSSVSRSSMSVFERSQAPAQTPEMKAEHKKKVQQVLSNSKKRIEALEGYLRALDQKGIRQAVSNKA